MGTWEKLDRLAQLAEVAAVSRSGARLADIKPGRGWPRVHVVEMPEMAVSSTEIRDRVRKGLPIDYLVAPAVATYIAEHGLYQGESDAGE